MILRTDPDGQVTESKTHTCAFHEAYPEIRDYPGCTCSASFSLRQATPEERVENRKRREAREARRQQAFREFGW